VSTGGFDTHDDHHATHPGLLADVNDSIAAFLDDLAGRGMAGEVLVMTTSEFGRRAADNGSAGLDHGSASVGMLVGPVVPGLHGEAPSLTVLDDSGNLVATLGFDSYYATVAERWLGVPAGEVLAPGHRVLDGVIAT
jgi:uncharacterized protein (DUF1501 family)